MSWDTKTEPWGNIYGDMGMGGNQEGKQKRVKKGRKIRIKWGFLKYFFLFEHGGVVHSTNYFKNTYN